MKIYIYTYTKYKIAYVLRIIRQKVSRYSESLTQTPQWTPTWCKCQMSRAPHLLAAQLKEKNSFIRMIYENISWTYNKYTHAYFNPYNLFYLYSITIYIQTQNYEFQFNQALDLYSLLTWDLDFLHNLISLVVDFHTDSDCFSMVINLQK